MPVYGLARVLLLLGVEKDRHLTNSGVSCSELNQSFDSSPGSRHYTGPAESQFGWCKDKWGISWQITPRVLTDAMARTAAGPNVRSRR